MCMKEKIEFAKSRYGELLWCNDLIELFWAVRQKRENWVKW